MGLIELEQQRTYDKKEGFASEGEGCLKGNFDKGTQADVSKFGNC
jgi:hypothetical protein